jgi:hypothetical protein
MKAVNRFLLRAQVSASKDAIETAERMKAEIHAIFGEMGKKVKSSDTEESKPEVKGKVI